MQKQISTHLILRIASCILSSGLGYYSSERDKILPLTSNSSSSNDTVRLFVGMQNPMNVKISV
ncbi:MAG: hypothetical protein ACC612_12285 [Methanomethylovorans sp.]|uniref:hypothetical protein n=1 Tax=Methanomethylovorans sp. TaxID=2758717 RepID=UPI0035305BBF